MKEAGASVDSLYEMRCDSAATQWSDTADRKTLYPSV